VDAKLPTHVIWPAQADSGRPYGHGNPVPRRITDQGPDGDGTRAGANRSRRRWLSRLPGGLRTVRATAFASWLITIVAMVEFTYGAQTVQLVVYATRSLGLGKGGYGVLLAAAGAGGLLSALVNGRLSTDRRVSLIVVVTGLLACATQLAYAGVRVLTTALAVTVIGNAGLVFCEVAGPTCRRRKSA
jgi:hypothetical protein